MAALRNLFDHRPRLMATLYLIVGPVLILVVIVIGVWSHLVLADRLDSLARQGGEAHEALCASKLQTQEQVKATERYLDDVRSGKREPIPGITTADLQAGLTRQRNYLRSLTDLRCNP